MKNNLKAFYAVTLAVIVFAAASATVAQNYAPAGTTSSATIERQIRKTIVNLPNYGVFDHIGFRYDAGKVTLTGQVLSLGTSSLAEKAVKDISGVTSVVNEIEDLPGGGYDNSIRRQLVRTLANQPVIGGLLQEPNPQVHLIVDRGRVTLEGWVDNKGQSDTIYIYASGVPGVFEVTNHLQIGKASYR